ncbi:MAG: hypothetical protein MAG551_00898 [Candidatus Scalindua arabica]|uniref:Type II toxin-antitoxin system RelE/ParE family toxin n=1 Tax=Candidatus Scalindua arabica TaxID=1127984 RepID=A0A941W4I3_9BACT|nr:hypothetical protein [Candidatus Scalindua arabica]
MIKLKSRWFAKWAKKNNIKDSDLVITIGNLKQNKSTVNLGSNLYKVRIAKPSRGKSGGHRTLVVHMQGNRAIYIYGFSKNEKDNLSKDELKDFRELSKTLSKITIKEIDKVVANKIYFRLEE